MKLKSNALQNLVGNGVLAKWHARLLENSAAYSADWILGVHSTVYPAEAGTLSEAFVAELEKKIGKNPDFQIKKAFRPYVEAILWGVYLEYRLGQGNAMDIAREAIELRPESLFSAIKKYPKIVIDKAQFPLIEELFTEFSNKTNIDLIRYSNDELDLDEDPLDLLIDQKEQDIRAAACVESSDNPLQFLVDDMLLTKEEVLVFEQKVLPEIDNFSSCLRISFTHDIEARPLRKRFLLELKEALQSPDFRKKNQTPEAVKKALWALYLNHLLNNLIPFQESRLTHAVLLYKEIEGRGDIKGHELYLHFEVIQNYNLLDEIPFSSIDKVFTHFCETEISNFNKMSDHYTDSKENLFHAAVRFGEPSVFQFLIQKARQLVTNGDITEDQFLENLTAKNRAGFTPIELARSLSRGTNKDNELIAILSALPKFRFKGLQDLVNDALLTEEDALYFEQEIAFELDNFMKLDLLALPIRQAFFDDLRNALEHADFQKKNTDTKAALWGLYFDYLLKHPIPSKPKVYNQVLILKLWKEEAYIEIDTLSFFRAIDTYHLIDQMSYPSIKQIFDQLCISKMDMQGGIYQNKFDGFFHYAVRFGNPRVLKFLVKTIQQLVTDGDIREANFRAHLTKRNGEKLTPLELAQNLSKGTAEDQELIAILQSLYQEKGLLSDAHLDSPELQSFIDAKLLTLEEAKHIEESFIENQNAPPIDRKFLYQLKEKLRDPDFRASTLNSKDNAEKIVSEYDQQRHMLAPLFRELRKHNLRSLRNGSQLVENQTTETHLKMS